MTDYLSTLGKRKTVLGPVITLFASTGTGGGL